VKAHGWIGGPRRIPVTGEEISWAQAYERRMLYIAPFFSPSKNKQNAFSARYFGTPSSGKGVVMKKAGPLRKKVLRPTLRLPRERQEFACRPYRFPCRHFRLFYPYRYRAPHTPARGE
jgi:hypothetical protein